MFRKLGLWLIGVAAIAALGGSGAALPAWASTSDWNQYQHDAAHTGSSPALGPTRPAVLPGWPVACGNCDWGPVVAKVGATGRNAQPVAFTGSIFDRTVFAYGIDGRPLPGRWPAELEPGIFSEGVDFPAVDTTGGGTRIFASGLYSDERDTGRVYGLNAQGQPLPGGWPWRAPAGTRIDVSPPTLVEGAQGDPSRATVYKTYTEIADWDNGYLTALGPDGSPRPGWPVRFDQGFPIGLGGSPAVAPDGTVYVVLDQLVGGTPPWDRSVRVDAYAPDGTHKSGWPVNLGEGESVTSMVGTPAVGSDGTLYVGVAIPQIHDDLTSGWIYAIAPDGQVKPGWPVRTEGGPLYAPVLAKNGTVYVSTFWTDTGAGRYESRVYALDAAGRTRPGWPLLFKSSSGDPWVGWDAAIYGMAGDAAANIYFASQDTLYAYGPDGRALAGWPLRVAPGRALRYPALAGNGVLGNGIVYVLGWNAGDPFSTAELYAVGNSKTSVRPVKKRPLPRKKTIDDFTATPGSEPPMPQWLKR